MSDQTVPIGEPPSPRAVALVADASAETRASIREALADQDLEIIEADDGVAAGEMLLQIRPQVALVNVALPRLSGAEALARSYAHGLRPFAILLSNFVLPQWIEVSQRVGAAEFLKVPVDARHVRGLIATAERAREPIRLLLVAANANERQLVRRMLEQSLFAFAIDEIDSGAHAVKLLRAGSYELALIDWNLPVGIDGLETACQGIEAAPDTRFLLMASGEIGDFARTARQFGVGGVLKKPFYGHDVDFAVHAAFGLRRSYLLNAIRPHLERQRRAARG